MTKPTFFTHLRHWPGPYDAAAADRLIARIQEIDDNARTLLETPNAAAVLRCLGGNSPYLSDMAVREIETLLEIAALGPDEAFRHVLKNLSEMPLKAKRSELAAALRQSKRAVALITAIGDIGGIWDLEQVTGALSEFAAMTLRRATQHLLISAHNLGEIRLQDIGRPEFKCGLVAIAMGKLGGNELNYSSDIDLILIFDDTTLAYSSMRHDSSAGQFTSRFVRDLVRLMEARDVNGYVFRTDLRLRPDPSATPPAISLNAALTYYETMGQNWERTAMIKARPIAGDLELGDRFLQAIKPFVWRRGLDFAVIADIHAMKRKIDQANTTALTQPDNLVTRIYGHNVKLGQGGIREIEFLVQTLQIVWGGRDPTLRVKSTLSAITRLVQTGHLLPVVARQLSISYRFLRHVEHRLQMVNDRQIHSLPDQPAELERIANFLGYRTPIEFASDFLKHVDIVRSNYRAVFEDIPETSDIAIGLPELDFRGDDPEPSSTISLLERMGYNNSPQVIVAVRQWLAGRPRALRSSRARDLMVTMVPSILLTVGRQANPDEAFNRFDRFINALPTGVQPMSLFQQNPILLERVAAVLGAAPILSEHLARYPNSLEGLLQFYGPLDFKKNVRAHLSDEARLEDQIRIVRQAVKERDFLLSVATLEGRLDANSSGHQRTATAEAALAVLVPKVLADFALRFGKVPGGALGVVTLGKAGGREMMAGSDLDLIFVYFHPPAVLESRGARQLPAAQWFVRAVQACVAALTAPGPEGPLFALDMRLRPSGSKGPIAVSLDAFAHYHEWDAWTWERMALTRARVVSGPPVLRRKITQVIENSLRKPQSSQDIKSNAVSMRARMEREIRPHGLWDVKYRPGGLIDIEFIAQTLQLIYVGAGKFQHSQTTRIALQRLGDAAAISKNDVRFLIEAEHLWRTIQGMLRITVGRSLAENLPDASATPLLKAATKGGISAFDTASLLGHVDRVAQRVRALFKLYVGEPD